MASPDDRRYAETHEWHKFDNNLVTIGVSQFAVAELTDITFVQITRQEGSIKAGEAFGEIESVKTTSELFAGINGTVVEVNQAAVDTPEIINQDPYGKGWLVRIRADDPTQMGQLMEGSEYDASIGLC